MVSKHIHKCHRTFAVVKLTFGIAVRGRAGTTHSERSMTGRWSRNTARVTAKRHFAAMIKRRGSTYHSRKAGDHFFDFSRSGSMSKIGMVSSATAGVPTYSPMLDPTHGVHRSFALLRYGSVITRRSPVANKLGLTNSNDKLSFDLQGTSIIYKIDKTVSSFFAEFNLAFPKSDGWFRRFRYPRRGR